LDSDLDPTRGKQLRGLHFLRIRGIDIIIDYSWFVIFFLVIYSMAESYFPQQHSKLTTPQYWLMGLVAAVLLFGSVLMHELAHSFVALQHGIEVSSIRLFIFGGVAHVSSEPRTGRHEFLIALAGPATSMILGFLFGAIYVFLLLAGIFSAAGAVAYYLCWANILLAIFNMIPGFPLDGGRILRAILWDRWNDLTRATKVVSKIGNSFALFLIVLGVLQFLVTQNVVSGLWMIFIGLFMKQSAVGSYHAVVLRQALAGVQVRQIMTERLVTVDGLTSADELVRDYIYKHQFTNFPVFSQSEFVGMVSLGDVKKVPKDLWPFKQVRDIMTPIELVPSLKPTDDATEALARMVADDLGRMPVIENGRLVGIVSRRDIMNLFKIKSDLGAA
jgi:Zn-dependent protease/predicted transcriptional regulator